MTGRRKGPVELPTLEQVAEERKRLRYRRQYGRTLGHLVELVVIVAALATILATWIMPIYRVIGTSMEPTLKEGQIVIGVKLKDFQQGDLVAFVHNGQTLIKRVEAVGGQWICYDEGDKLYILDDAENIAEAMNSESTLQVPLGQYFVLGDNRAVSVDSRSESMGCIKSEQIMAKVIWRIWPLNCFGLLME